MENQPTQRTQQELARLRRANARRDFAPTGRETIAIQMENVSSMELFALPDGRYIKALYDVSLTVPVGERYAVVGDAPFELELLAEIAGSVKPHEDGRCSLLEIGMMRQKRRILPHVYYINDQKVLFDHMHVLECLMFATEHTGESAPKRQIAWLKLLLRTGLYPLALTYIRSLGSAEYAAVSALLAYASEAKLVVMDVSHIEIPERLYDPFAALAREMTAAGKTLFFTTTNGDFAQRVCTRASFLVDGTIAVSGEVEAVCRAYDRRVLTVNSPEPERALAVLSKAFPSLYAERDGESVVLSGPAGSATLAAASEELERAGVPARTLGMPAPSLCAAFREVKRAL